MEYTNEQHLEQTAMDLSQLLKSGKITSEQYQADIGRIKKAFGPSLIDGIYVQDGALTLRKVIFTESELKAIPIKL